MPIEYNVTPAVAAMGQIEISGNVIPELWYKNIRRRGGEQRTIDKPYMEAITILAEIVYWYRPTLIRDEATGQLTRVTKKFAGDLLQRSYDGFAEKFGMSKDDVRDAIVFLEKMGLVKRHFRTIDAVAGQSTVKVSNVLFVELLPGRLIEVTHTELPRSPKESTPCTPNKGTPPTQEEGKGGPKEGGTNTKTNIENNTNTPAPAPKISETNLHPTAVVPDLLAPTPQQPQLPFAESQTATAAPTSGSPLPPSTPPNNHALLGFTTAEKWFGTSRNRLQTSAEADRILANEVGMTAKQQTEIVNTLADIHGTRALIDKAGDNTELSRLRALAILLWGLDEKCRTAEGLLAFKAAWDKQRPGYGFPRANQFKEFVSQYLESERNGNDTVTRQPAYPTRRSTGNGRPEPVIKNYTERAREQQRIWTEQQSDQPIVAAEIDY